MSSSGLPVEEAHAARWEVTLQYLRGYIGEWFDQNPLGQIGIVLMRDRLSETLVPMGGELDFGPWIIIKLMLCQATLRISLLRLLISGNWSHLENRVCRTG